MASMAYEGERSKPVLWMSGADSTKPLSDRRTRKSRHPMSGCSSGKCSSRSSMDVSMPQETPAGPSCSHRAAGQRAEVALPPLHGGVLVQDLAGDIAPGGKVCL